jgi:hypothetical protein
VSKLRRRRLQRLVILAVIGAAISAVGAWAYYLTHATSATTSGGTSATSANCAGTGVTPAAGDCSVAIVTFSVTSLLPGSSTPVTFNVRQTGTGSSVTRTFSLGSPTYAVTSTDPGCQAMITANPSSFTETGLTWTVDGVFVMATGVQPVTLTTPATQTNGIAGTFSLNYVSLLGVDQSACAGKNLTLQFGL